MGPVLPHEVVGFSGGNKYLFPGLVRSGADRRHALARRAHQVAPSSARSRITPVRAPVDAAAALSRGTASRSAPSSTTQAGGLQSLRSGDPPEAWAPRRRSRPRRTSYLTHPVAAGVVVGAPRYADLWTGAKGFYKVEPIVADGGEVVLYAPHITEIAAMHPRLMETRLPLPRLLPRPLGPVPRPSRGRAGHPPTSSERAPTTASPVAPARHGSACDRRFPKRSSRQANLDYRDSGASRHRRVGRGPGHPCRTAMPARCSTGCDERSAPLFGTHSPGNTSPICSRMASSVAASAILSSKEHHRLSVRPAEAAMHLVDLETQAVSLVRDHRCAPRRA